MLLEFKKLNISSMFSQICHWKNWEWIYTTCIVILSHVNKKSLFVCKLFIIIYPAIYFNWLVDIHLSILFQIINMLFSLPRCPNEIGINKLFIWCRSPPIAMFYYLFNYLIVVSITNCKFLIELEKFFLFFKPLPLFNKLLFYFYSVFLFHWIKLFFLPSVLFFFYFFVNQFF